ncbi:Zn-ribbon domain-containing OB-fold protein [Nocardia grenadensis]
MERTGDGTWAIAGARCRNCGRAVAYQWSRCPGCGGPPAPERFAGAGTVWSHTVVHIAVGTHVPPYTLAYVDLDNGPRILAHVDGEPVRVGSSVRLIGPSDEGDVRVRAVDS